MEAAALIISTLALIISVLCISLMLAKNFFSTHQVQMVPVDPMKDLGLGMGSEIGSKMFDPFREIGDPISREELDHLEMMKAKKGKMK